MKWITRERARVDRIACPWLIIRFIDPKPELLFVPAKEVRAIKQRRRFREQRGAERAALELLTMERGWTVTGDPSRCTWYSLPHLKYGMTLNQSSSSPGIAARPVDTS